MRIKRLKPRYDVAVRTGQSGMYYVVRLCNIVESPDDPIRATLETLRSRYSTPADADQLISFGDIWSLGTEKGKEEYCVRDKGDHTVSHSAKMYGRYTTAPNVRTFVFDAGQWRFAKPGTEIGKP